MILTVDIGNSTIKFGVFDGENLSSRFKIPTIRTADAAEIFALVRDYLPAEISAVVISSVVPELHETFRDLSENFFACDAFFVDSNYDFGLNVKYNPPEKLGIDRLIAAFAGAEKYGAPVIVGDFGTATTIDAVNAEREFLGGIITPGMRTLAESLHLRTSKLPHIELAKPVSVIGNSTVTSIQAGIFYGYIGLTEGILRRMIDEFGAKPIVVATGGDAKTIAESCDLIEVVDENLMLDGLRLVYEKNLSRK